jgi:hypothetical protein
VAANQTESWHRELLRSKGWNWTCNSRQTKLEIQRIM